MATRYYVKNDNTLGYITDAQPGVFGILHCSVLRGGTDDRLQGYTYVAPTDKLRAATLKDFEDYRVSPKGHIS
jgi:hypothetical protein